MDDKLRTRLIGAAVLFGLLAIFLPMFMHTEPAERASDATGTPAMENIPLEIPPPSQPGLSTRVLPVDPAAPIADIPASDEGNPAPEPALPTPPANPIIASDTQGAIARDPAPVEIAPATTTAETPPVAAVAKPTVVIPTAVVGGRYGVNFGSFGSQANAEKLIDQLAAQKIRGRIEPVSGKNLFRVTVRGLGNRNDAEKIRLVAQSAISGINASVLEAALEDENAPINVVPAAQAAFAIQIGVYADKIKAAELIGTLKSKGFAAFAETVTTPAGQSLRVRVGPVIRRADADKMRDQIKTKTGFEGIVVSHS